MPKSQWYKLPLSTRKEILNEFRNLFIDLNKYQLAKFLFKLLTQSEKMMFAKRLTILKCLRKELDYDQIKKLYRTGNTTIAKLHDTLTQSDDEFVKILDKLTRLDKIRWENYLEDRKKAGGVKSSMMVYARKKQ